MKKEYNLEIEIPEGTTCEFVDRTFKCKKGDVSLEKVIFIPGTEIKIEGNKVLFNCKKGNKKDIAIIKTNVSHVENMFKGLCEKFVYELEICTVHFPMTVKVEEQNLVISNFLGEKINRIAKIFPEVEVEVEGQKIIISGSDIEKTGQTAANIEKATKVQNKDRRIFQDGIFMTSKPGGGI